MEIEEPGYYRHWLYYQWLDRRMSPISEPSKVAYWTTRTGTPAAASISFGRSSEHAADRRLALAWRQGTVVRVAIATLDPLSWTVGTLPEENAVEPEVVCEYWIPGVSAASRVYAYIVFRHDGHIIFRSIASWMHPNSWWREPENLSSRYSTLTDHMSPSIALKPVAPGAYQPHVSWSARVDKATESFNRRIVTRQRVETTWQPYKLLSHGLLHNGTNPSISYDSRYNRLALFFQCGDHIGYTSANPTNEDWGWSPVANLAAGATNPSSTVISAPGEPISYPCALWSTGSSSPYPIIFHYHGEENMEKKLLAGENRGVMMSAPSVRPLQPAAQPLTRLENTTVTYHRAGDLNLADVSQLVPQLAGVSGAIALYLEPFQIETGGGSTIAIDFSDPNASNGFADWLGTKQRIVPQNGRNAHAQGAVLVLGLEIEEGTTPSLDLPLMQAVIKNVNSGQTVSSVFSLTLRDLLPALGRDTVLVVSARRSLASLRGKPMRIDTRIVGLQEGVEAGFGAIYHTADGGEGAEMQNLASTSSLQTELPTEFALHQNYPNPFNPLTVIRYSVPSGRDLVGGADGQLPVESHVSLKIYDLLGREVATLVNETKGAGYYETTFDASHLGSGVYFYRMQAVPVNGGESFTQVRKFVVMK